MSKKHYGRPVGLECFERGGAVVRDGDVSPQKLKQHAEAIGGIAVVVYHKDATRRRGRCSVLPAALFKWTASSHCQGQSHQELVSLAGAGAGAPGFDAAAAGRSALKSCPGRFHRWQSVESIEPRVRRHQAEPLAKLVRGRCGFG
jgi:hypothetical protein